MPGKRLDRFGTARRCAWALPHFTLIGATTRYAMMSPPLREYTPLERQAVARATRTTGPTAEQRAYFRRRLLAWSQKSRRSFPWRKTDDPFAILLSEVLLQRTQASQVSDHFDRILGALPNAEALAGTPTRRIHALLRPLGLSKRAVTLKAMGREIVERFDGRVPVTADELMTLPGVGPYIAAATACFAGGQREAVVDTNVVRVLARYFGVTSQRARPRDDMKIWETAELLLPRRRYSDYNQALLDFAALICRPRTPLCEECPLRRSCPSAVRLVGVR